MLEKRHGTMAHAHRVYRFWGVVFGLMVLYSLGLVIYGYLRPRKRYHYRVPGWLVIVLWTLACAYGIFTHMEGGIHWWARRFARMSVACAVFGIFLSFKPAILPRTYSIPLTLLHKWVGRCAVIFALLHGILYTKAYADQNVLSRFLKPANFVGILVLFGFLIMGISSLRPIRQRWYYIFCGLHYPLAILTFAGITFHARPNANVMVALAFAFLVAQVVVRVFTTKTVAASVRHITPTLDLVTLDRSALPAEFNVGSHLRVSPPLTKPKAWISSTHPYTIASLPADKEIKLVVRKSRFQFEAEKYAIRGPFTAPFDVSLYKKVVVVAGGAGVALIPPISRAGQAADTEIKCIWAVPSEEELPVLSLLGVEKCNVYVTQSGSDTLPLPVSKEAETTDPDAAELTELDDLSGPVSDREGLLDSEARAANSEALPKGVTITRGRPILTPAIGDFWTEQDKGSNDMCIVACGPATLAADAQRWASEHGCDFFAEAFSI